MQISALFFLCVVYKRLVLQKYSVSHNKLPFFFLTDNKCSGIISDGICGRSFSFADFGESRNENNSLPEVKLQPRKTNVV